MNAYNNLDVCVLHSFGGERMFIHNWKKEILTIPNILSLFRLALIPVYMLIYLNAQEPSHYFLASAILTVSCLTDLIDGKIARHFNMISTVGKILDPVADKATQFTLIVCLAVRYPSIYYLIALFLVKESFMLVAGACALKKGKMLSGALMAGKICTTVLFISLILLVMLPTLSNTFVNVVVVIDAVFMIIALVGYVLAYFGKNKKIYDVKKEN